MKKALSILAVLAAVSLVTHVAHAQEGAQRIERTIKLEHGVTPKIQELTHLYTQGEKLFQSALGGSSKDQGLIMIVSDELGWIRVTGTEDKVTEFEALVRELDVPPPQNKNLEVVFFLLKATETNGTSDYPDTLEPVIDRLKATFQYGAYHLLDTALLRTRVGSELVHQSNIPFVNLQIPDREIARAHYTTQLIPDDFSEDGRYGFKVNTEIELEVGRIKGTDGETFYTSIGAEMVTSIDIREGQSVVLGKSNFDNSNDALFVVMQLAKVE